MVVAFNICNHSGRNPLRGNVAILVANWPQDCLVFYFVNLVVSDGV
jgi:hypothetical protein